MFSEESFHQKSVWHLHKEYESRTERSIFFQEHQPLGFCASHAKWYFMSTNEMGNVLTRYALWFENQEKGLISNSTIFLVFGHVFQLSQIKLKRADFFTYLLVNFNFVKNLQSYSQIIFMYLFEINIRQKCSVKHSNEWIYNPFTS